MTHWTELLNPVNPKQDQQCLLLQQQAKIKGRKKLSGNNSHIKILDHFQMPENDLTNENNRFNINKMNEMPHIYCVSHIYQILNSKKHNSNITHGAKEETKTLYSNKRFWK